MYRASTWGLRPLRGGGGDRPRFGSIMGAAIGWASRLGAQHILGRRVGDQGVDPRQRHRDIPNRGVARELGHDDNWRWGRESPFGLNPAARAQLATNPPPKHGKFDDLIGPLPGRGARS